MPSTRKRKSTAVPVRGGWNVLPHGMGAAPTGGSSTGTVASDMVGDEAVKDGMARNSASREAATENTASEVETPTSPALTGEATITFGATTLPATPVKEEEWEIKEETSTQKRRRSARISSQVKPSGTSTEIGEDGSSETPTKKLKRTPKKTKDNPYGLTPGLTSFPDWAAPSAEACEEVYRILADTHDDVQPQPPEIIPAPSLVVAGCGEVPCVLDALLRTLLSGATTFDSADKMINGLARKFGTLEEGIGKGSIDWNKVRLSDMDSVVSAIRDGGLANLKAKNIKAILDMVHLENMQRRDAFMAEREAGVIAEIAGASEKTKGQKDLEIFKADQNILSLDYIRDLSVDDAMKAFTKYPGVGVKTSACVILFCLQRPCFAVDTHVYKFSRWLGWVPKKADVNDVFKHLEVRCPNHLKYGLHQLFIRHGKVCGKCRMDTVTDGPSTRKVVCPLEHLLDRYDKRPGTVQPSKETPKVKTRGEAAEAQIDSTHVEPEGGNDGEK